MSKFAEQFLPEFEHEMAGTRQVLALAPQSLMDWQAHENLNSIGWVASHLVDTIDWAEVTINQPQFDLAPVGQPPHQSPMIESASDLVPTFDRNLATAKKVIGAASDADYDEPWTLLGGGEPIFTMPRAAVVKSFLLNHVIHHRAFLIAYLRMNDIQCPGLYGP